MEQGPTDGAIYFNPINAYRISLSRTMYHVSRVANSEKGALLPAEKPYHGSVQTAIAVHTGILSHRLLLY